MPRLEIRPLPIHGGIALILIISFAARRLDEIAFAALVMPAVLYAGVAVARAERLFVSRLLGAVAVASIAPAAYAAATGGIDVGAALLWLSLAALFAPAFLLSGRRKGQLPKAAHTHS